MRTPVPTSATSERLPEIAAHSAHSVPATPPREAPLLRTALWTVASGILRQSQALVASHGVLLAQGHPDAAHQPAARQVDGAPAGPRRIRLMWQIAVIALALRVVLLPLGHPWDITTFYNMFVDVGHGRSPYDTMRYLNAVGHSALWGHDGGYEGYAYPPALIYLYWPLAHLFVWLHPTLTNHIPIEGLFAVPTMPWDFYLWLKLPFWLGDLAIAAILWRMTGSARSYRDYLLNPYVLLISGCWTFDSIMVACLLAGVYWLERGHTTRSALALALGTMVKFVPGFIVPTCLVYMIQRRRPWREVLGFAGVYAIACTTMALPNLSGLLYVVGFQGSRAGQGLHAEMIFAVMESLARGPDWYAVNVVISSFSTALLAVAMPLVYGYLMRRQIPLHRMVLITLLVYLLTTKVVNEQYILATLPFSFLALHAASKERTPGWRTLHVLLWLTPLIFAAFNVPLDRFLLPLYHTLFGAQASLVTKDGNTGFSGAPLPWNDKVVRSLVLDALAIWFMALIAWALVVLAGRQPLPPAVVRRIARGAAAVRREGVALGRTLGTIVMSGRSGSRRRQRGKPTPAVPVSCTRDESDAEQRIPALAHHESPAPEEPAWPVLSKWQ